MTNTSARGVSIRRSSRNRRSLRSNQSQTIQSIRDNARNPSVATVNRGSRRSHFDLPSDRRRVGPNLVDSLEEIKRGRLPSTPLHEHAKIKDAQKRFLNNMTAKSMAWCSFCNQRSLNTVISNRVMNRSNRRRCCKRCDKEVREYRFQDNTAERPDDIDYILYGERNDMDPWPRYDHLRLPKLNTVEEMIIARVHPFMRVYRLSGGVAGYKGSVCSFEQDLLSFIDNLPNLPANLPILIVRKPDSNSPNGYSEFKVNRANIIEWLVFLKQNNPYYRDIDIDRVVQRANELPEDGSIASHFRVLTPGKLFLSSNYCILFSCILTDISQMNLSTNSLPLYLNKTEALRQAELLVTLVETELCPSL